ncbi:hypothetical protein [Campylobacter volucris]|uniref:hypothetical protein n=1 Tax=Campylobacter volucris TaxID=1031542 RepID=UPI00189E3D7A|nr:hypothetical protein [Campylobacter volucris]MBF7048139.1 hypothetical protein [Campylobacter volucris]
MKIFSVKHILAYIIYICIIIFITFFIKVILPYLTYFWNKYIYDFLSLSFSFLAPYLGLIFLFLGTLSFGLIRGFKIILIVFLISAPATISYCYIKEMEITKIGIFIYSYLVLVSSFLFSGQEYQNSKIIEG